VPVLRAIVFLSNSVFFRAVFASRILIVLSLIVRNVPGQGLRALIWLRISCAGFLRSISPSFFSIFLQNVALWSS